jgi:hypothetical protein
MAEPALYICDLDGTLLRSDGASLTSSSSSDRASVGELIEELAERREVEPHRCRPVGKLLLANIDIHYPERGRGGDVAVERVTSPNSSLTELIEAVRSLDYGRPSDRSVEGMLREGRGTCSTKHLFLADVLAERFPETQPQIVHRVYRLDHDRARELFGAGAAAAVPDVGVVDVHRYLTATIEGRRVFIDVTFSGEAWDGRSSMRLACGPGQDHPVGADPDGEKRALEAAHCDPAIREPFIAALARMSDAELRIRP